jgi:riboflavin kinase/FMN adenylyltransferase
MQILKTSEDFRRVRKGNVLTIGNFDGVHLGHQEILARARAVARAKGVQIVVMTFEPHPVAILHPEKAPGVLTPLPAKLHLLQDYADDCIIVLEDSKALLNLSPKDFVDKFLLAAVRPAALVEGDDFNFGADRAGDVDTLRQFGREKGFDVIVVPPKQVRLPAGKSMRVSSTLVRYMLESGHVAEAAIALSRPYRLSGRIVSGWGRGRKLGFPTLNMDKPNQIIPADGVYAGFVEIADGPEELLQQSEHRAAVFSIGRAATFGDEHPRLIEAHVLDTQLGEVTGKWMAMDFVQTLRSQHKFNTPKELKEQIAKDCKQAKRALQQTLEGDRHA